MSDVDFSKPLICSDPNVEVIKVFPVKYENPNYTHVIVLREKTTGNETVKAIGPYDLNRKLYTFNRYIEIFNAPPKIVDEEWRNLYKNGHIGHQRKSRGDAESAIEEKWHRDSILHSVYYDNGDVKREIIPV